ncbi:DNA cytosine methyltransferase [Ochrobactrum sp. RH2CCR150]|uniref:DNA cytosine methyltransferase n=1 Tax=Ochrobactrum sp. RH2CCR150 TaxID=2587044 RepID=UPI0015FE4B13|nr:DNA (cytosine-5)-methyltransferase 1 [Ochrobactrum sp. RH2CCR150]
MNIGVFDFFSGCGGTSKGFQAAGLVPAFALDFDKDAGATFQKNFPQTVFSSTDITRFNPEEIEDLVKSYDIKLFCGCAPCQPFTRQNTQKPDKKTDLRRSLLSYFGLQVERFLPDYIFVENVPGIQKVAGNSTLTRFIKRLEALGYKTAVGIIEAQRYGVPQRRRRLVLLASKHGEINLPDETHGPQAGTGYSTVRDWIAHLPAIRAGETHPVILNHRAASLSEINLKRIRATPIEGTRADWPTELRLHCHTKTGYSGHTDVYGRMRWDGPATGLTTRCISLSNGRYGHPEQDRAISVREAASLQTFPDTFEFLGSLNSQAKQIGNAVPVVLAQAFGAHIVSHAKHCAG